MLIDAGSVLKVAAGAVAALGGKKLYDKYFGADDLDDEMAEVYMEKGPGGLARFLKAEGYAEDRDEALDMVADFEDDNEDVVHKYAARRVARREEREAQREAREAQREAREAARKSRTSSRRATSATA